MTTRERWLATGLGAVTALLVALFFWQQVRYGDAQEAVREYVRLEGRARGSDPGQALLVRQARGEVRNSLLRGDFGRALQRMASLSGEDAGEDPEIRGKGIPVDALWRPGTPERERARGLLRLLAEKQKSGHDLGAAQETLVKVADAARRGKRDAALAAFAEVETLVRNARLRPGFKAPAVAPGPGAASGPAAAPGGLPPVTEAEMAGIAQFQAQLPQMVERAPIELRPVLRRLQSFASALIAAHRGGKDVRAVMPLAKAIGATLRPPANVTEANRLLDQADAALKAAPPLASGARAPAGGAPTAPAPALPAGPPPQLPPAAPPRGGPAGAVPADRILAGLDTIRSLPEPVYQQQRPFLAAMISGAIGGAPTPGARQGVGDAKALRLEMGQGGEVAGLRVRGQDLSAGLPGGGFALAAEGRETPLRAPVKNSGKELAQTVKGPEGGLFATYRRDADGIFITARTRRTKAGKSGELVLRLPLRAAGWRWSASGDPQVIAIDGAYTTTATGGTLASVMLQGAGAGISITAPTAASVSYEPAGAWLVVRFPLTGEKGAAEHSVRLAPVERPKG